MNPEEFSAFNYKPSLINVGWGSQEGVYNNTAYIEFYNRDSVLVYQRSIRDDEMVYLREHFPGVISKINA